MFARVLEFAPKMEKKDDFIRTVKNEVLPILRKQHGFLEILPFVPETRNEKVITISLWTDRKDAERYERDAFARVDEILRPYLTTPLVVRTFMVETTLCEHFEKALAA